ncbi:MAG: STN domain-containing protein [bacterium]|nr:STN domain-containing protein [bacterium]
MKDRKTHEAKQEPQPVNWPQWMRSGLCALLITSAQPAFGSLNAQNVITMSFRNATVEQVLDRIEQDTDYTFLYSDQMVDRNRKVSINVESQSLEETLKLLFAGTNIRYRIVDHQVILSGGGYFCRSADQAGEGCHSGCIRQPADWCQCDCEGNHDRNHYRL